MLWNIALEATKWISLNKSLQMIAAWLLYPSQTKQFYRQRNWCHDLPTSTSAYSRRRFLNHDMETLHAMFKIPYATLECIHSISSRHIFSFQNFKDETHFGLHSLVMPDLLPGQGCWFRRWVLNELLAVRQGYQIGKIFACWAVICFEQLFRKLEKFVHGKSAVLLLTNM
jgi:hypothetical protein